MFSFSKSTNAPTPSIRVSVSNGLITAHQGQQVVDLSGEEIVMDIAGVVPIALGLRKGAAPCTIYPAPGTDVVVAPQVRDVKGDALFNTGHEIPVLHKGTWYILQFTSRGFGEGLDAALQAAGLEDGQLLAVTVPGPDGWTAKSGSGAYGPYSYRVPQFAKPRGIDPAKVKSLEAERANREARRARAMAGQDAAVAQFVARFAAPGSVVTPAAPPPYYPPQPPQGYAPPPQGYPPQPQGYQQPPQPQQQQPPQQPPQPARGARGGFIGTLPKAGGNSNDGTEEF